jgi:uncharacterized membrane protein HdeD (DUF308 family)
MRRWIVPENGPKTPEISILIPFAVPALSIWGLGLLPAVDLISHGLAWLLYALQSVRKAA